MCAACRIALLLATVVLVGCTSSFTPRPLIEGIYIPSDAPSDLVFILTSVRERAPAASLPRYIPQSDACEERKWQQISAEYWQTALTLFSTPVQTQLRRYAEFYQLTNAIPAFLEQAECDDDQGRRRYATETLLIISGQVMLSDQVLQPLYEELSEGEYEIAPARETIPGRQTDYENWRSARISAALQARIKK